MANKSVHLTKYTSYCKLAYLYFISQALSATMGNTEVIRPMHTFYLLRHESSIQNVFLISDGHINNEDAMLSNSLKNSQHTRIFTMGVRYCENKKDLYALK